MITKGIIVNKILGKDKYNVRIPFLEQTDTICIREASICQNPGTNMSFNENDVVFISFEDHNSSKPVIIGKLELSKNNNLAVGSQNNEILNVSLKATLPKDTTIGNISYNQLEAVVKESGVSISDTKIQETKMPLIRVTNIGPTEMTGTCNFQYSATSIDTNKLRIGIEVIGNNISEGDILQVCTKRKTIYNNSKTNKYRRVRYRLRPLKQITITNLYTKQEIELDSNDLYKVFMHCNRRNRKITDRYLYVRIARRELGPEGQVYDSLFSNTEVIKLNVGFDFDTNVITIGVN